MTARVVVRSWGVLHGTPPPGLTVDCGPLRDPDLNPALRALDGRDEAVRAHVLATPGAAELVDTAVQAVCDALTVLGPDPLTVVVVCQGGRHRSVAIAEAIGCRLRQRGVAVDVVHDHMDLPVVERAGDVTR